MACTEIALQAGEQLVSFAFHVAVRQCQQLLDKLALDQAADHAAEFDAPVVQYLVQPVDFAGAHRTELVQCCMPDGAFKTDAFGRVVRRKPQRYRGKLSPVRRIH